MNSSQNTTRHVCCHCQSEVLTGKGCTPLDEDTKRLLLSGKDCELGTKWVVPMKKNPSAVREGALSGCPFFVRLWEALGKHCTSPEALDEARLFFEVTGVKLEHTPIVGSESADDQPLVQTLDRPSQELYDITECNVMVITQGDADYLDCFTTVSDWDDPSANHALARLIDGHTSSSQAIGQLRRRLQYCLAHHDDCKSVFSDIRPRRFLSVGGLADSTVKVVQAQSLVNGIAEPYAALSYCWGQDQVFKTTSENKDDVENGIPLSLLPKTITDAIHITRELGIKLLWVDSLCLVQDEEDELAKEVAKMHHYYGNAHVTISAATATSCNEGFLQDHAMPRTSEDVITGPFYFPVDLGIQGSLSYLKLFLPSFETQAIDSRAWTLQEGLLSHRLISFSSRVVRWSCRTESYGKSTYDDTRGIHESFSAVCSGTEELSDHDLAWRTLKVWCRVVDNYTKRDMSNQGDRLPAISGIASVLSARSTSFQEREHQVDFLAGFLVHYSLAHSLRVVDWPRLEVKYHPQNHFESGLLVLQLLWDDSTLQMTRWIKLQNQPQESQPSSYIAPSWSWASHVGTVGMAITHLDDEWFQLLSLTAWEQGLRVCEVCANPSKSEAPYGALSGGSITLNGRVFRPDEEQDKIESVAFDDGRRDIAPGDCGGLFCLQIVANIDQPSPNPRVSELYENLTLFRLTDLLRKGLHGIVLEPVKLEDRFQSSEKVYRRVGVYYIPGISFWSRRDVTSSAIRGSLETITII